MNDTPKPLPILACVLVAGLVFGGGLAISGMHKPEIVLGFLQLDDMGLLLVLGLAVVESLASAGVYRSRIGEADLQALSEASGTANVQALAGKPLLPDEVPRLPVEGCGRLNCECRYAHYDDRRGYRDDRRSVSTMSSTVYEDAGKRDRRNHQGRRETDL